MIDSAFHTGPLKLARSLVIVLVLIAAPVANARGFQSQAREAIGSITEIVPEANMIFIIDGVARQRQSDAGQAMTSVLDGLGITREDGPLSVAWSGLAAKLKLDEDEAFDKFFGRRAIFVSDGLTIGGDGQWAIATVMPIKLAYTVLEALGAKRRDFEAGHTVFAIEDGTYRISLVHPRGNAAGKTNARLFVVSPRGSNKLFRKLVRGLSTPNRWADLVGQNNKLPPQIAGVFRADGQDVGVVNILQTDAGWHGQAIVNYSELTQQTAGWSGSHLDAISAGAWLALTDEVDPVELMSTPVGSILQLEPEHVALLSEHTTKRCAVTIRPARKGVSVMAAIETDGTAKADATADATMKKIAEFLTGRADASPDFQGFMSHATRTVNLDGVLADEFLEPVLGKDPTLSWLVQNEPSSGWWIFRLGPTTGHEGVALRALASKLPDADDGGRNISLVVARPGPLASMVDLVIKSKSPIGEPINRIELIRWSERLRPGKMEIGFELRMNGADD